MSVYVDALFVMRGRDSQAARLGALNGHRWCHLMADDLETLHAFAARIGMKREWFQGDHYDLTPSRRAAAVKAGAVEVDAIVLVNLRRRARGQPPLVRR